MTTIFIIALAALAHGERLASQDANLAAMAPEVIDELVPQIPTAETLPWPQDTAARETLAAIQARWADWRQQRKDAAHGARDKCVNFNTGDNTGIDRLD